MLRSITHGCVARPFYITLWVMVFESDIEKNGSFLEQPSLVDQ